MDMYCRTCFRANGTRKFDISAISQVSDVRISDMLIYCLQIEITPYDLLPQLICEACLSTLNTMFLFRKHCYHSDTELRKMLDDSSHEDQRSPAPDMDLELNLVDVQVPVPDFAGEIINLKAEEDSLGSNSVEESPQKESQETPKTAPSKSPVVNPKRRTKLYECYECDYKSPYKCNIIRHQHCREHTGWRTTSLVAKPSKEKDITAAESSNDVPNEMPVEREACPSEQPSPIPSKPPSPEEIPSAENLIGALDENPVVVEKYLSKLFECKQCDYRSSVKCNIVRHQQCRKHTGIRIADPSTGAPLKAVRKLRRCQECDFQTFDRSNFQRHQWTSKHRSCTMVDVEVKRVLVKAPTCPHCGIQRANLQAHMAQWCRVLRAKRLRDIKDAAARSSVSASAASEERAPSVETVEMKIEIQNS